MLTHLNHPASASRESPEYKGNKLDAIGRARNYHLLSRLLRYALLTISLIPAAYAGIQRQ